MSEQDHRSSYFYELGISIGLEQAARDLIRDSGILFADGRDGAAKELRLRGNALQAKADRARPAKRCHTYEHTASECPGDHGK